MPFDAMTDNDHAGSWSGLTKCVDHGGQHHIEQTLQDAGALIELEKVPLVRQDTFAQVDRFGVFDKESGDFFGAVSPNYNLAQPRDIAKILDDELKDISVVTKGHMMHKGHQTWVFQLGDLDFDFRGSVHQVYLMLRMGHDGGLAISGKSLIASMVCANEQYVGEKLAQLYARHTGDVYGRVQVQAEEMLATIEEQAKEFVALSERLSNVQVEDPEALFRMIVMPDDKETAYRLKAVKHLVDQYCNPVMGTFGRDGYDAFNALTNYETHLRRSSSAKSRMNRLYSGEQPFTKRYLDMVDAIEPDEVIVAD